METVAVRPTCTVWRICRIWQSGLSKPVQANWAHSTCSYVTTSESKFKIVVAINFIRLAIWMHSVLNSTWEQSLCWLLGVWQENLQHDIWSGNQVRAPSYRQCLEITILVNGLSVLFQIETVLSVLSWATNMFEQADDERCSWIVALFSCSVTCLTCMTALFLSAVSQNFGNIVKIVKMEEQ